MGMTFGTYFFFFFTRTTGLVPSLVTSVSFPLSSAGPDWGILFSACPGAGSPSTSSGQWNMGLSLMLERHLQVCVTGRCGQKCNSCVFEGLINHTDYLVWI